MFDGIFLLIRRENWQKAWWNLWKISKFTRLLVDRRCIAWLCRSISRLRRWITSLLRWIPLLRWWITLLWWWITTVLIWRSTIFYRRRIAVPLGLCHFEMWTSVRVNQCKSPRVPRESRVHAFLLWSAISQSQVIQNVDAKKDFCRWNKNKSKEMQKC